jgi:allantoinase
MGCQHGLLLLADHALAMEGEAGLATVWTAASSRPAKRWGLSDRKGRLAPGCDADIVLIERCTPIPIQEQDLLYRHKTSPYVGMAPGLGVRALCLQGNWKNALAQGLPPGGAKFLTRRA